MAKNFQKVEIRTWECANLVTKGYGKQCQAQLFNTVALPSICPSCKKSALWKHAIVEQFEPKQHGFRCYVCDKKDDPPKKLESGFTIPQLADPDEEIPWGLCGKCAMTLITELQSRRDFEERKRH